MNRWSDFSARLGIAISLSAHNKASPSKGSPMADSDFLSRLVAQAREATRLGDARAASQAWEQVLKVEPEHSEALLQCAVLALTRGHSADARVLLERALRARPDSAMAHAYLARIHLADGNTQAAVASLDAAIHHDPLAWGARLEKAKLLESLGRTREAALSWSSALHSMPENVRAQPQFARLIEHASEAVSADRRELLDFLHSRTVETRQTESRRHVARFEHSLEIATGHRPFVTARPLHYPVPGLPAVMFFDRTDLPWTTAIEAASGDVLEELQALTEDGPSEFEPYVQTRPGDSAAQFGALDSNRAWSAYFLWKHGTQLLEHCNRCPRTLATVAQAPLVHIRSRAPAVFFSRLAPGTHIPPHHGATNSRLTVHLPLVIPDQCGIRVGDETRHWRFGEVLVFDDTILHEAWNNSAHERTVLIFDVWHPMLTMLERELITQAIEGMVEYYEGATELGEL